eukprot:scaffold11606_cov56-Attheya_sp.AAC.7
MPRPIPGGGGSPLLPGRPPILPTPTPWTGAAPRPTGAAVAVPRPAPLATPGPPGVRREVLEGGGPSTAMLTTVSPRNIMRPNVRFS